MLYLAAKGHTFHACGDPQRREAGRALWNTLIGLWRFPKAISNESMNRDEDPIFSTSKTSTSEPDLAPGPGSTSALQASQAIPAEGACAMEHASAAAASKMAATAPLSLLIQRPSAWKRRENPLLLNQLFPERRAADMYAAH